MADQLQLEVVTPERRVLSEPVNSVTVPGRSGELQILPGHAALISELKTGVLPTIKTEQLSNCTSPAASSKSETITFQYSPKSLNVLKKSTPPAPDSHASTLKSS